MATDLGLIMFCWGDDNNSQETIKYLKSLGMHGIIYDKMDKLTTKTDKVRNGLGRTELKNEIACCNIVYCSFSLRETDKKSQNFILKKQFGELVSHFYSAHATLFHDSGCVIVGYMV